MIIAIASGKGGTGKTTVSVNLALSLSNVRFLDCDVEEPNSHIFLNPKIDEENKAFVMVPSIDETVCDYCGTCKDVCKFNSISVIKPTEKRKGIVTVFPELCHSCGSCQYMCQKKAIREVRREIGIIQKGRFEQNEWVSGKLNIGEAISPPLIRQVKNGIRKDQKTVIVDAPPGTSCPVVAAVEGCDFCILVTEPTPFGLNDFILAEEMLKKLKIPFGAVVNRFDMGDDKLFSYLKEKGVPILMKIPFKIELAKAYSEGIPFVLKFPEYKKPFRVLHEEITKRVKEKEAVKV